MDALKSATSKAPMEAVQTMWEDDYEKSLLTAKEEALKTVEGSDNSNLRVEEVNDVDIDNQKTDNSSVVIKAGPDLPLPSVHKAIDISKIAEDVEKELEEENDLQNSYNPGNMAVSRQEEEAERKSSAIDIKEDNDGEWIVVSSPDKRTTRMQIELDDNDEKSDGDSDSENSPKFDSSKGGVLSTTSCEDIVKMNEPSKKQKKAKTSKSSSNSKKSSDKKKKTKNSSSTVAELYSIERSLRSFQGNVALSFF